MFKYQRGYICNGYTFVVNKEDVHNAPDSAFVDATALLPMPWPPTNADRIRAMSDEEMAEMLYSFEDLCMPDYCQSKKECNDMLDADIVIPAENCKRCLVDWLQQPAEEADHA